MDLVRSLISSRGIGLEKISHNPDDFYDETTSIYNPLESYEYETHLLGHGKSMHLPNKLITPHSGLRRFFNQLLVYDHDRSLLGASDCVIGGGLRLVSAAFVCNSGHPRACLSCPSKR